MLSITDVLKMLARGEKLPQQKLTPPTEEQIDRLQNLEPEILNDVLSATDGGDPGSVLLNRINGLADEFGWYQTASVLCMLFAHRYEADAVPALKGFTGEVIGLLRMFAMSDEAMSQDSEGAWTIPFAILADLGRKEALAVTACAGFCATVGHLQSASAGKAE